MNNTNSLKDKTSIIIVSWNCREALRRCLKSLEGETEKESEIIVCDNASSDGTVEMLRKDFPHVRVIENIENLGFGIANNMAADATDASRLFVLNPDTEVMPGAVKRLNEFLRNNREAGIAAPLIMDESENAVPSVFRFPNIINYWTEHSIILPLINKFRKMTGLHKKIKTGSPMKVDWATGAAIMVRREALGGEPLFDPMFFMYSEDADLCKRLADKRWGCYLVPEARIVHFHRGSSMKALSFTIFHHFHSMQLYYEKHKSKRAKFCLRLAITVDMLLRIIIITLLSPGGSKKNQARLKGYKRVLSSIFFSKRESREK